MESAALVAPLTHHPFVSKSQAPSGWNLLQQVAPLTHLAPVTHHRTVVGTCHWWVTGRRPNSLEYQICTAPEPFDTLVTGLVCNSAADYYRVERAVASRLKGCPPPILRFSLSPQAGEVSRSRSHSVSRTGPNLLLFRLVTSARTPCH